MSAGFIAAVVLLLSLLNYPTTNFSDIDVDGSGQGSVVSASTDQNIEMLDSAPQTGQPEQSIIEPTLSPTPEPTASPSPTPTPVDFDELVGFYQVKADLYYNDVGYSSNSYEYTENDLYMLAQLIYGEARGESTKGKIAVGNVVMNRVISRGYPGDTIEEVITAPGQFTGYSSSIKPSSACKYAARMVLEREVWVIPQNVYFFNSDHEGDGNWGSHEFYTRIDGHAFYTESYSGRSRNGEVPPQLFERTFQWPQYGCKPEKRVYRIQIMLREFGYSIKADSYFGKTTKEALIDFQANHKLKADGVAGPSTIKALINAYGEDKYCAKFS
ncbi:MAG: cell wall hydrolase [Bacillota bacterium]